MNGVLKVLGSGDVDVAFHQRSYSVPFNNKGQTLSSSDYTITNGEEGADAATVITYKDADGKPVAAPKNAGVYTATVTVPEMNNKNQATDSVPFEITAVEPKLTLDTKVQTIAYDVDTIEAAMNAALPTAGLTGVTGDDLSSYVTDVVYKVYKDGELMVNEDGEALTRAEALTAKNLTPGVYTMTAQWLNADDEGEPQNANYTASQLVTSAAITVKSGELAENKIPTFDSNEAVIAYGDDIDNHVLYEKDAVTGSPATVAGTFYTVGSGKVTKTGEQVFNVWFQPEDTGYAAVNVGRKTITAGKATLTEADVEITNTAVAYDGKAHALAGAKVLNKKFASDKIETTYSASKSGPWSEDINSVTYTEAGNGVVWVKFSDGDVNYNDVTFAGYVSIGTTAATLSMQDTTAPYEFSDDAIEPTVVLTLADGKTIELDAKYVDYQVAKYDDNLANIAFTAPMAKKAAHVTEEGYMVKATVKADAMKDALKGYAIAQTTVYAKYTVTKADLDESKVPSTITDKELAAGTYDGKSLLSTVADLTSVTEDKDPAPKTPYTGSWGWVNGSQILAPDADFTVQYVPVYNTDNLDDSAENLLKDYNLPTAKVNAVVAPATINVDAKNVTWDPEKAAYGLTAGDITVEGLEDVEVVLDGKTLTGTWVWTDGEDYVLPKIGENELKLVFADAEHPSYYAAEIPVTVTIEKAEPVITVTNTTMGYTGNPASLKIESTNTENSSFALTWYDAKGNTMAGAPTQIGSYKVKVTQAMSEHFVAGSVTVDYTITYNQTGIEGFVYRLYAVALGREPDQSGYTMWVNLLKSKEYTPKSVANGFIFSPEFQNRKYDNATFLKVMYSTFMDREPDASGYTMWLKGLNSGEYTREFVFQGFADSREFTNICARYGL